MSVFDIVKIIAETGILILIAAIYIKNNNKNEDMKNEQINLMLNKLINMEHNLNKEESTIAKEGEIQNILKHLMHASDSARAFFIRYHNGGRDLLKNSFLKMSMTNEIVRTGIAPMMQDFKEQYRACFNWAVTSIQDIGHFEIENIHTLKEIDYGFYIFLKDRGVVHTATISICTSDGQCIGFIGLEYLKHKTDMDWKYIKELLEKSKIQIETILQIK